MTVMEAEEYGRQCRDRRKLRAVRLALVDCVEKINETQMASPMGKEAIGIVVSEWALLDKRLADIIRDM